MKLTSPKSLLACALTLLSTQAFALKVTVPAVVLALGSSADATPVATPTAASTLSDASSSATTKPSLPAPTASSKILYNLESAANFTGDVKKDVFIQLGCFKDKANAEKLLSDVKFRTDDPVALTEKNGLYFVTLGPYYNAEDVRAISQVLGLWLKTLPKHSCKEVEQTATATTTPAKPESKAEAKPKPNAEPVSTKAAAKTTEKPVKLAAHHPHHRVGHYKDSAYVHIKLMHAHGTMYIAGDLGIWAPIVDNTMTVNNGTDFPGSAGLDTYTTNTRWGALIGVGGGYRWDRESLWLPAYSIGVRYKHLFATNIGQQIIQYSTPEFTNYNYTLNVASDVVMLAGKIDLLRVGQLSPFINGGVGISFNRVSNYNETALPGVTARDSAGFANNSSHGFAYAVGAGVDWQVHPQLIMSLNYEFQGLGSINTRSGINSWSGSHLHSGTYQSNNILLSMNYLFEK